MRLQTRSAFTLIELLVVIAIIAIVAAIVFPVISGAKRKAREPVDVSNLHQLYMAFVMYEEDSSGASPMYLGQAKSYAGDVRLFSSMADTYRKSFSNGTWPGQVLIPCSKERVPFKLSYAYLRDFPPYDENPERWSEARNNVQMGLFASPWHGTPITVPALSLWCGDGVVATMGPPLEGPILRIRMDGSYFRLPKNRHIGAIGNPQDLFGP